VPDDGASVKVEPEIFPKEGLMWLTRWFTPEDVDDDPSSNPNQSCGELANMRFCNTARYILDLNVSFTIPTLVTLHPDQDSQTARDS
jgi:hypothetical protein